MKLYFSGNPQVYGGADPISVLYDVVAEMPPLFDGSNPPIRTLQIEERFWKSY